MYWTLWSQKGTLDLDIMHTKFQDISSMNKDKRVSFQLSTQVKTVKVQNSAQQLNFQKAPVKLRVYNFLDDDNLHLRELNEELNEELVYLEGKGFSQKSIEKIQHLLAQ